MPSRNRHYPPSQRPDITTRSILQSWSGRAGAGPWPTGTGAVRSDAAARLRV